MDLARDGGPPRTRALDWGGYPILRFPQMPERIDVHLIDRKGQPFLGMGEVARGPTGAALANAFADATGTRMRDLPLSRRAVKAALGARGHAENKSSTLTPSGALLR